MRRVETYGAVLAVALLLAWLRLGGSPDRDPPDASAPLPEPAPEASAVDAAELHCMFPITWRILRVDDGFGVTPGQAREAVQRAATLWDQAVGRPLFAYDSLSGFPVRLVYGEPQARTRERLRLEAEFQEEQERLEAWREELAARTASYEAGQAGHARRGEALQRRVAEHNAAVRGWNERGDAPEAVIRELGSAGDALDAERVRLEREEEQLAALGASLQEEARRFSREADEHRRRNEALEAAFPDVRIESGIYREVVRSQGGRLVAIDREVRINRFEDLEDLTRVAAHELGHALGLGHVDRPGHVMSGEYGPDAARVGQVQPGDVALLRARCPELWRE